jgi:hypothetical protein
MGFQASIASANVGDKAYSPLWRIQATTWKDPSRPDFLTSLAQITSAAQAGKLSTNIAGVVVNCPFVEVQTDTKTANTEKKLNRGEKEIPFLFFRF